MTENWEIDRSNLVGLETTRQEMAWLDMNTFIETVTRKRIVTEKDLRRTRLAKVFTTLDLVALGIGATIGVGVYVLSGDVAKNDSGPAIVVSFAIAAFVSVLAGLCFAEFGARVPKAGSAYLYSYVTVGELTAFIIGVASVAKAFTKYFDVLANGTISQFFKAHVPISAGAHLSDYFDLLAFAIVLLYTAALAIGVKESIKVTMVFTFANLFVILFTIVNGLFLVDTDNWGIEKQDVPVGKGEGGFAPYGFAGIMKGAAKCFYAYIGFDAICNAGEETQNPKRAIPIAVIMALAVSFVAYSCVSGVTTMMVPYYQLNEEAPLSGGFVLHGWKVTGMVITYGSMFGLATSLMGVIYPLPRIAYAMASDGLIFKFLAKVSKRFKTPMVSTLIMGLISGFVASIFNLDQLVDMMSIGTLMAYTMVAMCVLILRYEVNPADTPDPEMDHTICWRTVGARILPRKSSPKIPDTLSSHIATTLVLFYLLMCVLFCLSVMYLNSKSWIGIAAIGSSGVIMLILMLFLAVQPCSTIKLSFRVPFSLVVPCLSMVSNIYLMLALDFQTWVRFIVWMAFGMIIYLFYGLRHSEVKKRREEIMADK